MEARDPYTAGHQRRVADLSRAIAVEIGLPSDRINGLRLAATIHDLGKISMPGDLLCKPSRLSEIESDIIKTPSKSGFTILKDIESLWPIARIILEHHERMDGTGYPRGLVGHEILLESRIPAVADVVEAMASHRPLRPTLGIDPALDEISGNRGSRYDPDAVDAYLRLFYDKHYRFID